MSSVYFIQRSTNNWTIQWNFSELGYLKDFTKFSKTLSCREFLSSEFSSQLMNKLVSEKINLTVPLHGKRKLKDYSFIFRVFFSFHSNVKVRLAVAFKSFKQFHRRKEVSIFKKKLNQIPHENWFVKKCMTLFTRFRYALHTLHNIIVYRCHYIASPKVYVQVQLDNKKWIFVTLWFHFLSFAIQWLLMVFESQINFISAASCLIKCPKFLSQTHTVFIFYMKNREEWKKIH